MSGIWLPRDLKKKIDEHFRVYHTVLLPDGSVVTREQARRLAQQEKEARILQQSGIKAAELAARQAEERKRAQENVRQIDEQRRREEAAAAAAQAKILQDKTDYYHTTMDAVFSHTRDNEDVPTLYGINANKFMAAASTLFANKYGMQLPCIDQGWHHPVNNFAGEATLMVMDHDNDRAVLFSFDGPRLQEIQQVLHEINPRLKTNHRAAPAAPLCLNFERSDSFYDDGMASPHVLPLTGLSNMTVDAIRRHPVAGRHPAIKTILMNMITTRDLKPLGKGVTPEPVFNPQIWRKELPNVPTMRIGLN